jgi:hypothetical protein
MFRHHYNAVRINVHVIFHTYGFYIFGHSMSPCHPRLSHFGFCFLIRYIIMRYVNNIYCLLPRPMQ